MPNGQPAHTISQPCPLGSSLAAEFEECVNHKEDGSSALAAKRFTITVSDKKVIVNLFPTLLQMRDALKIEHKNYKSNIKEEDFFDSSLAATLTWNRSGEHDEFGQLFFSEECMGAGIVAHEAVHLALDYCKSRTSLNLNNKDHEEYLATAVEDIVKAFWAGYYA